jgi:hypothetical protein
MDSKTIILLALILACIVLSLCILSKDIEAFENPSLQQRYTTLRTRLTTDLAPYCSLSARMHKRMKEMYMLGEQLSEEDALKRIKQTLKTALNGDDVVPCSTFTELPDYTPTSESAIADALSQIPDNLPIRIEKELKLYSDAVTTLQGAIDEGMKYEGFVGSQTCSSEALKIKRQKALQAEAEAEAASCNIPDLDSEITRLYALLQSPSFSSVLESSKKLSASVSAMEINEQKAKNGELFSWQKSSGTKKSYATFTGKDNVSGLLFSLSAAGS